MNQPPVSPPQILEAMKAVNRSGGKPVIMEVVGKDGLKVGEHVIGGKVKKPKYYVLEESYSL